MSQLRLIETTLLVLVGLLLALATVNDLVRQTHVNDRLIADLSTWRHYTGHDYRELSPDQKLLGEASKREVVCGNTQPGPQYARPQICLEIWGPVRRWTARRARRLVPAGERRRRPAPLPPRLLRSGASPRACARRREAREG